MSDVENPIPHDHDEGGVHPPPRWLLWGVIAVFVLGIVGVVAGVVVFREVLRPGQQQRVLDVLPFMRSFMRPTPVGGTIPTPVVTPGDALNLLNAPLFTPTPIAIATLPPTAGAASSTPAPTLEPTLAATLELTPESTPETGAVLPATSQPTPPPVVEVQPTSAEALVSSPVLERPPSWSNTGFVWERQTWNNCGPANVTIALSYYGWREDQAYAAAQLRPEREDKNVTPQELVAFVNEETQVRALSRIGGDTQLLRRLIAAEFPVIIESGAMFEGYDWVGHYETVVGYDDSQGVFYIYDSFRGSGVGGAGITTSYTEFDQNWRAFNRVFIVIYHPDREAELAAILGPLADPLAAAQHALSVAEQEWRSNPRDPFALFNMGTALTRLGRYEEAANAFDRARMVGELPWRMLWYQFGIYEAYFAVERYDDVMALVEANLNNGGQWSEETHYWQGRVLEAQGDTASALAAYRAGLAVNANSDLLRDALQAAGG